MMPIASCSNPLSATLECTTVEFIDDILVSYPTNALTQLEDLASESLPTSDSETLVSVESFQDPRVTQIACRSNLPNWKNNKKRGEDFNEQRTDETANY